MVVQKILRTGVLLATAILLLAAVDASAQYKGLPVKKEKLIKVLRSKQLPTREIVAVIKKNGVDFQVPPAVERELVAVGARPEIITAAKTNYRAPATKKPPAPTKVETAAEDYDRLLYEGYDLLAQNPTTASARSAINLAKQASQLDATRPDAFKLTCVAYIVMRQFGDAGRTCQQAIDRGGSLSFPVVHLNSGPPHAEMLYVGNNSLSIESGQKLIQLTGRDVVDIRQDNDHAVNGSRVTGFSIQTSDGGAWCFAASITWSAEEAGMIMRLISQNAMGR